MTAPQMTIELMRDLERDSGWWLLVDGSEQSYVDTTDPTHLEFEYVQLIAHAVEAAFAEPTPLAALHLGGGLCTVPRWLAVRFPDSRQQVAEHSADIAELARSLGVPPGVELVVDDAFEVLGRARRGSLDLVVCDVYDGPETVTELFTTAGVRGFRRVLRRDGVVVCNLSDATPFSMAKVVVATIRSVFGSVAVVAEPPVLRGRRSGNLVVVASQRELPIPELARRTAGGLVRGRVLAGDDLEEFVRVAAPARSVADIPASGESTNRPLG
jgi:spermidine synthase